PPGANTAQSPMSAQLVAAPRRIVRCAIPISIQRERWRCQHRRTIGRLREVATGATLWMVNVGTKDLKNRLSHYLRLVREGERVIVCDRGEPIAEIRSTSAKRRDERAVLKALAQDGVVTVGRGKLEDFEPVRPRR